MKPYYTELTLPLSGMSCTACASSVESILKSQNGVFTAEVNYSTSTVKIKFDASTVNLHQLQMALKPVGYELVAAEQNSAQEFEKLEVVRHTRLKHQLIVAIVFAVPVFIISMIWHHASAIQQLILLLLSLPVIFYSGSEFYKTAYRLARLGKTNMDTLVALGTAAAFILSLLNTIAPELLSGSGITNYVYYESAVVIITLILLGRFLEERSRNKASTAIKGLMGLQADTAIRLAGDKQETVPISSLFTGDIVLIRPGNTFPVDGIITEGSSWVEESMMTGEPVPVYKKQGDQVLAGTQNKEGVLQVKTIKTGAETTLSRIISMVNEAQNSKPPVQLLVDKISAVFVPVVILLSLITFAVWFFIFPEQPTAYAIVTAISVLIIACPCALGLATPTALITAIGNGAKRGILFRDASGIESAGKTHTLLIDKTGTLTVGKPQISDIIYTEEKDKEMINSLFLSLTSLSAHPLSAAVAGNLSSQKIPSLKVSAFVDIPGKGISGTIDGKKYFAGNPELLVESEIQINDEHKLILEKLSRDGKSVVLLSNEQQLLAIASLTDMLRDDATLAVASLKEMNVELHMLTGDHHSSAAKVADLTGIKIFKSGMSPEDKANYVDTLRQQGRVVCMAGDGINDTIALARADVGMAMGTGSDASREVAAITLTGHKLMLVADAIRLSRKTNRIIKENLIWAFGYNVIAIPIAAGLLFPATGLLLNPMIASAAMAFSSVSVVLNSLRLR
ncbi:MAG: heavy metal translocating P-type ATPase [Lentimicrobium sp.]|jgi:Cu2+-exporting ATPase|nr:heavy metal translocating P-type ATPase [Lentimicrobium sp.]